MKKSDTITIIHGSDWWTWAHVEWRAHLHRFLSVEETEALIQSLAPARAYRFWRIINAQCL